MAAAACWGAAMASSRGTVMNARPPAAGGGGGGGVGVAVGDGGEGGDNGLDEGQREREGSDALLGQVNAGEGGDPAGDIAGVVLHLHTKDVPGKDNANALRICQ